MPYDTRTCRERQDAELEDLRARVAALEAALRPLPLIGSIDSATGAIVWTAEPPAYMHSPGYEENETP